jgi:hypothetical protein
VDICFSANNRQENRELLDVCISILQERIPLSGPVADAIVNARHAVYSGRVEIHFWLSRSPRAEEMVKDVMLTHDLGSVSIESDRSHAVANILKTAKDRIDTYVLQQS